MRTNRAKHAAGPLRELQNPQSCINVLENSSDHDDKNHEANRGTTQNSDDDSFNHVPIEGSSICSHGGEQEASAVHAIQIPTVSDQTRSGGPSTRRSAPSYLINPVSLPPKTTSPTAANSDHLCSSSKAPPAGFEDNDRLGNRYPRLSDPFVSSQEIPSAAGDLRVQSSDPFSALKTTSPAAGNWDAQFPDPSLPVPDSEDQNHLWSYISMTKETKMSITSSIGNSLLSNVPFAPLARNCPALEQCIDGKGEWEQLHEGPWFNLSDLSDTESQALVKEVRDKLLTLRNCNLDSFQDEFRQLIIYGPGFRDTNVPSPFFRQRFKFDSQNVMRDRVLQAIASDQLHYLDDPPIKTPEMAENGSEKKWEASSDGIHKARVSLGATLSHNVKLQRPGKKNRASAASSVLEVKDPKKLFLPPTIRYFTCCVLEPRLASLFDKTDGYKDLAGVQGNTYGQFMDLIFIEDDGEKSTAITTWVLAAYQSMTNRLRFIGKAWSSLPIGSRKILYDGTYNGFFGIFVTTELEVTIKFMRISERLDSGVEEYPGQWTFDLRQVDDLTEFLGTLRKITQWGLMLVKKYLSSIVDSVQDCTETPQKPSA